MTSANLVLLSKEEPQGFLIHGALFLPYGLGRASVSSVSLCSADFQGTEKERPVLPVRNFAQDVISGVGVLIHLQERRGKESTETKAVIPGFQISESQGTPEAKGSLCRACRQSLSDNNLHTRFAVLPPFSRFIRQPEA